MDSLVVSAENPAELWPVFVCLLGGFRVFQAGRPVAVRSGGKTEAFISRLALQHGHRVSRDMLLEAIWPDSEQSLAGQALDALMYSLHKLLGDALGGARPVLHVHGGYELNTAAGVRTDIDTFIELVQTGERFTRAGEAALAIDAYARAAALYTGDLEAGTDIHALIERENVRARYMTLLGRLADFSYAARDYSTSLARALQLLESDPCREDAHRVVMRCYAQLGERSQALRQYHLCLAILRSEFDAPPESRTTELYDQVRLQPQIFEAER